MPVKEKLLEFYVLVLRLTWTTHTAGTFYFVLLWNLLFAGILWLWLTFSHFQHMTERWQRHLVHPLCTHVLSHAVLKKTKNKLKNVTFSCKTSQCTAHCCFVCLYSIARWRQITAVVLFPQEKKQLDATGLQHQAKAWQLFLYSKVVKLRKKWLLLICGGFVSKHVRASAVCYVISLKQ